MMDEDETLGADAREDITWHTLSVLVILILGSCYYFRTYRAYSGRSGYFIVYSLAAISLLSQYTLLRKLLVTTQDEGFIISSHDNNIWNISLTNNFNPPTPSQSLSYNIQEQPPFSPWSACLLVKDNNIILPEWLAYHYTVLPLRRLIVAVDPTSNTDPRPILDLYQSIGMNITVWTDNNYWVDGSRNHEKRDFRITNETSPAYAQDRLVYRQKIFYHACLKQLKTENRTWTAVIDADEYIAFNYLDESSEGAPSWCLREHEYHGHPRRLLDQCTETCSAVNLTCETRSSKELFYCKNTTCADEYLRNTFRTKLNQSATAAEHIHNHVNPQFDRFPCIVLARYLFSSRGSDRKIIEEGVDKDFNATLFHTVRYRFRSELNNPQPGKSIIDVSRYDGRNVISPHRLHRSCLSEGNAWVDNFKLSFRVHHYVGSWESFRLRGFELFMQRNYQERWVKDNTTPLYTAKEGTKTWLSQFATLVGSEEKALNLTERIRVLEEREVERILTEPSTNP
ncbi:hypothetical protein ACHAXM_000185 [Skeletonema potamos]